MTLGPTEMTSFSWAWTLLKPSTLCGTPGYYLSSGGVAYGADCCGGFTPTCLDVLLRSLSLASPANAMTLRRGYPRAPVLHTLYGLHQ